MKNPELVKAVEARFSTSSMSKYYPCSFCEPNECRGHNLADQAWVDWLIETKSGEIVTSLKVGDPKSQPLDEDAIRGKLGDLCIEIRPWWPYGEAADTVKYVRAVDVPRTTDAIHRAMALLDELGLTS